MQEISISKDLRLYSTNPLGYEILKVQLRVRVRYWKTSGARISWAEVIRHILCYDRKPKCVNINNISRVTVP